MARRGRHRERPPSAPVEQPSEREQLASSEDASTESTPAAPPRAARRVSTVAWLVVGLVLPAALLVLFVARFGVNLPVHDEWTFIPALDAWHGDGDWLSLVTTPYQGHRAVVPELGILLLSEWTRFDVRAQMYLSILFLFLCGALFWLLVRRSGWPAWTMVPIGWLLLSLSQFENLLVGWQVMLPFTNLLVLAALLLLAPRVPRVLAAIVPALVATFSFATGPVVWPAGLLALLLQRRRHWPAIAAWLAAATVAAIVFLSMPTPEGPGLLATIAPARQHLDDVGKIFLAFCGNSFGGGVPLRNVWCGAVLLLVALATGWLLFRRRPSIDPAWAAIAAYGLGSALLIAVVRYAPWEYFGGSSRYVTVTAFLPVVLAVMVARLAVEHRRAGGRSGRVVVGAVVVLAAVALFANVATARVGWRTAAADEAVKTRVIPCLLQYRTADAECLRPPYLADPEVVRRGAAVLERWRLGPFASTAPAAAVGGVERIAGQPVGAPVTVADPAAPVTVDGWLVTGDRPLAAVILVVDGGVAGATSTFYPRLDVDAYLQRPLPPCGWSIQLPTGLAPGVHQVQALGLPVDAVAPLPSPLISVTIVAASAASTAPP